MDHGEFQFAAEIRIIVHTLRVSVVDEIKSSSKKELMSDLAKILSENQKEIMKMIAPAMKKKTAIEAVSDTDSQEENISPVAPTSTPLKSGKEKKKQKYDPIVGRNTYTLKTEKQSDAPAILKRAERNGSQMRSCLEFPKNIRKISQRKHSS